MKYLLVLLIVSQLLSCKKAKDNPPAPVIDTSSTYWPTQNGANRLVFKKDKSYHIYSGTRTLLSDNGVVSFLIKNPDGTNGIRIMADDKKYDDELTLFVTVVSETNKENIPVIGHRYNLSRNIYDYSVYYTGNGSDDQRFRSNDSLSTITFTRFDDKVIAGTFEFHSVTNKGKTVDLTEGYFDIPR